MSRDDTCIKCKYWAAGPNSELGQKGLCKRRAPVVHAMISTGLFPITLEHDWCGEFEREVVPSV